MRCKASSISKSLRPGAVVEWVKQSPAKRFFVSSILTSTSGGVSYLGKNSLRILWYSIWSCGRHERACQEATRIDGAVRMATCIWEHKGGALDRRNSGICRRTAEYSLWTASEMGSQLACTELLRVRVSRGPHARLAQLAEARPLRG